MFGVLKIYKKENKQTSKQGNLKKNEAKTIGHTLQIRKTRFSLQTRVEN